jgi:hypothetical protein
MIEIMQGTPGSGKSAAAVARAILHIRKGGLVASNFSLVDGWAEQVSKRLVMSMISKEYRQKKAISYYNRFYRVNSLPAIRALNPREQAEGLYKDTGKFQEGMGLLILDEAQLVFNCRNSMTGSKNLDWVEFFTQHRKLGWNVLLIAHTIDMIDSQIRPLAEYESRFRNMQKVKFPIVGLPMSPIPLFLVIRRYAGLGAGANVVADRDLYPLPLWAAKLYDSLEVFSGSGWGADQEPKLCGKAPEPYVKPVEIPVPYRSTLSDSCLWSMWENESTVNE